MKKQSLWKEIAEVKSFPKLNEDKEAEVVVIGGGITGLTTAMLLTEAGKNVIVLEASAIGDGTTGFSTCHLTTDIDEEYRNIVFDFNTHVMKLVADSRMAGINFIEETSQAKKISCDFQRVHGYRFTEIVEGIPRLKEEFDSASQAGLNVSLTDIPPLPFAQKKSLRFENQAQFNAQKYLNGLAGYLREKGCQVFENSRVNHIEEKDDYFWIRTNSSTVKVMNMVMATHIPLFFNVLQTVVAPYRSYVMAAKLRSANYPEGLFWDTAKPYHYISTYRAKENNYLVVGGEDHKTGHEENSEENFRRLEKYIRERFDVEEISYRWSAQYYEPADGLPYIGRSPFSKKAYLATGFSGDGLVYGTVAGLIISDLVTGRENKWLEAYDSTRFTPAASAYGFIKENSDVVKHFVADRIEADTGELSDLKDGEGKILTLDGHKIAAARDEGGELHACSPSCSHMGCFVKWNNAEKSWDCPCHGSRFNMKGEIIYGPAVKSLRKIKLEYDVMERKEKIRKG